MKHRKVYIISPYAGDVEKNARTAIAYCRLAILCGYMPIASHLLYPQMLNDSIPNERKLGLEYGLEMLAMCDEVWVCGNVISKGMTAEIEEAKRLKKRIIYNNFFTEGVENHD